MAPVDRREHRQQRVRGAGPSSVQASFGFNFGALGARPAKQASLPPQRSSRRTPVQSTPRGAHGSTKRNRSASLQRSSASKSKGTPQNNTVTPQLGKRKRGSTQAQPSADDGEEDELSPDREELVRSIEKSRRVVGTVSPIREELDDAQDELTILQEGSSMVREAVFGKSAVTNRTPVQLLAHERAPSGSVLQKTPIADRTEGMSTTSRRSLSRRSKSTDPGPITPGLLPNGRARPSSAARSGLSFATPRAAQVEQESEDELTPRVNGATPRVVGREEQPQSTTQEEAQMDVDELSPQSQQVNLEDSIAGTTNAQDLLEDNAEEQAIAPQAAKRGRPRRVVEDDEDEVIPAATPVRPVQRGRPRKDLTAKAVQSHATPSASRPSMTKNRQSTAEGRIEEVDELSPERERTTAKPAQRKENVVDISSGQEDSDEYEEPELEREEEPEPTPRPAAKAHPPKDSQLIKPSMEKPPRKRQKFLGPKHAISVMRIKGSAVRGITIADTTRTILEQTIDHRLNRMAEKLQTSQDSDRRKELRSEINLSLSFKESLNEKLLDLQDANDVLSTNFKKVKLFRRDNAELRKEILGLQNSRQEVALEQDDVQAGFEADKAVVEARSTLSDNMFDIQAAIQNGRDRARKEGRDEEGPEIPLGMLLETVGKDVGSLGGGLLANVKGFNGLLERAAGWLEGRA